MSNWLFDKIIKADSIKLAIAEGQQNNPSQPWTVVDIADLVQSELDINLDTDDTDFFGRLLSHFNNSN